MATALGVSGLAVYANKHKLQSLWAASVSEPGSVQTGLPTYTAAQVAKHKSKQDRIWVTYKHGVYDITDYVAQHPGGNKIMLGAGAAIDPYWDMYAAHKQKEIFEMLEKYRIGNILELPSKKESAADDPYAKDPVRNPVLKPSNDKPFNAEPPPILLRQDYITPNEIFFVRNHLPVPGVKPESYKLEISVDGTNQHSSICLRKLRNRFPKKSTVTTIQCAGNRRGDMVKIKSVKGLNWGTAAISTAEWSGATLNDVLLNSGIDIDKLDCKHIQFEGMDKGPDGTTYGASIPIELARDLKNEILIAYQMNGVDIPADHGYPVRVIIPGIVGARQVKWLNKIVLSNEESSSHWQQRDYKGFNSSVDWHNVDFDKSIAIQMLPVQSAICEPEEGDTLEDDEEVTMKGYAWSGGGRAIYRVDVSADGGKTWVTADLLPTGQSHYRAWAWTFWEAQIPLPKGHKGKVELICKACDAQYNVQPDNVEGIWNLRGCLSNAWHRVQVNVPK